MPMTLSAELKAALDAAPGRPLELIDGPTGTRYLIVAAETLGGWKEGDMSPAEQAAWYAAAAESFGRAGWDDPVMDEYNNYDENYRKRFGHDPR